MLPHLPELTVPDVSTILLASVPLVVAAVIHFVLARMLRSASLGAAPHPDAEHTGHEARARVWLAHLLQSAAGPLALIIWIIALHFATTTLLDAPGSDQHPKLLRALEWLRGGVVFLAILWLLIRVGRVIETRLTAIAKRTPSPTDDVVFPLLGRGIRIVLPLLAVFLGTSALQVSTETRGLVRDATSLLIIAAVSFLLLQTVDAIQEYLLRQYRLDVENNYRARAVHTQVRMLRRLAVAVIGIITFGSMLMVFDSVRRFGTTILASAGVAGVVIGFAAQRSIATLLAGFQIALTQPIRIDDVVIVETEYGRIEEITLTYVVVKLWDLRRLVLPITYFIEKPFQNWTRSSDQILGTVFLYVDYTVPLDSLRAEFFRVVQSSDLWDGQVCGMQVTDTKEHCVEVRGLMSASNASHSWDLRCEAREKLLVWLAANHPRALPQTRVTLDGQTAAATPAAPAVAAVPAAR